MIYILVTGSNGQLGNELKVIANQFSKLQFTFTDVEELDITDYEATKAFLSSNTFDFCINCAAYTAVDKAESDIDAVFKLNVDAVKNVSRLSNEFGIKLIHISTDFVFDGKKSTPYLEDDFISPLNIYGKSKWEGEDACLSSNPKSLIIRTSWLYSSFGNNFVKTMQRLGKEKGQINVIYDQVGTPTYAGDLADVILNIINDFNNNENFGIFHYSNEGVCSWYDFAVAIMELSQLNCKVIPIEATEYPTPAKRAAYAVLNKKKIKESFHITIPHWRESLKKCISILDKHG